MKPIPAFLASMGVVAAIGGAFHYLTTDWPKVKDGEWYAHRGTGQRIEVIATGTGKDLFRVHGKTREAPPYLVGHKRQGHRQ